MTYGPPDDVLFRRARRWPWVVGVLAIAVGAGAALGATLLDDDGGPRHLASTPSASPSPTPEPSLDDAPSDAPSESASSEPSPTDASPSPELSASTSSASALPTPLATRTPSAPPRPSRTPAPTASAGYPPPGMRLEVTASKVSANRARIRVRVTDTDGTWNGGHVDFGDGTSREFPQSSPACSGPPSSPYQPAPSDRTVDVTHDYPSRGTYDVFVRVRTDRPCEGTPEEQASKVVSVTVDDATPGPTPTPILTPPAAP
jgi:hypothetical protein